MVYQQYVKMVNRVNIPLIMQIPSTAVQSSENIHRFILIIHLVPHNSVFSTHYSVSLRAIRSLNMGIAKPQPAQLTSHLLLCHQLTWPNSASTHTKALTRLNSAFTLIQPQSPCERNDPRDLSKGICYMLQGSRHSQPTPTPTWVSADVRVKRCAPCRNRSISCFCLRWPDKEDLATTEGGWVTCTEQA